MLKKVIPIVLLLCLIFSVSAIAENQNASNNEKVPQISQKMPQGEGNNMDMPARGNMPNGEMPPKGMNRGQRPSENALPPQGETALPQNDNTNDNTNNTQRVIPQTDADTPTQNSPMPRGEQQFGAGFPAGMGEFPTDMQNFNQNMQTQQSAGFLGFIKTYSTPIVSIILLALAFIFVIFYRRKNY